MTVPTDTGQGIFTSTAGAIDAPGRHTGLPARRSGRSLTDADTMTRNARIAAMAGGTLISLWGLARGLRRGSIRTIGLAGVSAGLLFSAARAMKRTTEVMIETTITVSRPRAEIFKFWSDLENFPRFMRHLESVTRLTETRSRWVAANLGGKLRVEWEAEIVHKQANEHIAWRSLPGSDIFNEGMVSFRDAPTGRGTELHVVIEYRPPAGSIGGAVARFLNRPLAEQLQADLRNFKAMVETGEAPTTVGQPAGRSRGGSPWTRAWSGGMERESDRTPAHRSPRRTESHGVTSDTVHEPPTRTRPGIPGVPGGSTSYGTEKSDLGPTTATPQGARPTVQRPGTSGKEDER